MTPLPSQTNLLNRPFLKWPGGKYRIIKVLQQHIPSKSIWVEPFVGAGAMFLNTPARKYLLNDYNEDLINLYETLKTHGGQFIKSAKKQFCDKNNTQNIYYKAREAFNFSENKYTKAELFLFLNRHGYNGLCRYNLKGGYNVPFGNYHQPYFPEAEMLNFLKNCNHYRFHNECFKVFLRKILRSKRLSQMVIYCDPPYTPISKTANFTGYAAQKFSWESQEVLADLAKMLAKKGAHVFISNHDLPKVRQLYTGAKIIALNAPRNISCKKESRLPVKELLAEYVP